MTASATDPELLDQLGLSAVPVRGPDRRRRRSPRRLPRGGDPVGLPLGGGAALRPAHAFPARGQGALRPALGSLLDLPIDTTELDEASEAYIQQVSEAVAADEETAAYVDELESRVEELEDELPSGDSLAAELTRYLREREQGGEGPPPPSEQ